MPNKENEQALIRFSAVLLNSVGSLSIAVAVLHFHSVLAVEKSIDLPVETLLVRTRKISIAAVVLLALSAVLALAVEVYILSSV